MRNIAFAIAASLAFVACAHQTEGVQNGTAVTLRQGALRGVDRDGVHTFLNIPFAAPPVGAMRWRPPGPAPAWNGVRDASKTGPACPQVVRPAIVAGGVAEQQSEDCLQLNVWRPASGDNMPVMVWIHGGAHVVGSGAFPVFDGTELARQGVVVITINYRLGLLGYFAHPSLTAEAGANEPFGNYGLMDQIAALQWVRDNIRVFGGDPDRVTVFGESAGAISVMTLLSMESAKGLFSSAIVQSGVNLLDPRALNEQELVGRKVAEHIGLGSDVAASDLRATPAEVWTEAAGARIGGAINPFIDGRLLREAPWRVFAANREIDVPLLIGANSNEASVLLAMGISPEAALDYAGADLATVRTAYGPALDERELARQLLGDAWFVGPARWLAESASDGAPSYLYHFDYVSAARRARTPGAAHGGEIAYVFKTLPYLESVTGHLEAEDRRFAEGISACWTTFAKTHVPVCPIAPSWPAYDKVEDSAILFAPETRVVTHFRKNQLDLILSRHFEQGR